MTTRAETVVGWCPGALRPMASGDGLIVRVKPRGGVLPLDAASALTKAAIRFGNGALDLTGRGNLQIRGVRPDTHAPFVTALDHLGLIDADPEDEAARNILVSPLAGLDPEALVDISPVLAALEERWRADKSLRGLPAKWSMILDDGGPFSLRGFSADVRFEAEGVDRFRVTLGEARASAICGPDEVADVAAALARLALDPPQRMKGLLATEPADTLLRHAGLKPCLDPLPQHRPNLQVGALLGAKRVGTSEVFGIAPAFGSLPASALATLVATARTCGATDLRLTPWRVVLVTGRAGWDAPTLSSKSADLGLVTQAEDPRLSVVACVGAPACHRATTPVRAHAAEIARERPREPIHVSGCLKGCARAAPAPVTLVGREGRYDIVVNGRADDAPTSRGLPFQEALTWLSRWSERTAG